MDGSDTRIFVTADQKIYGDWHSNCDLEGLLLFSLFIVKFYPCIIWILDLIEDGDGARDGDGEGSEDEKGEEEEEAEEKADDDASEKSSSDGTEKFEIVN